MLPLVKCLVIFFCICMCCDILTICYAQENNNGLSDRRIIKLPYSARQQQNNVPLNQNPANQDVNRNDNVLKQESYRLPVQSQDILGSYNEGKKVQFKQIDTAGNLVGSQQANMQQAGSVKRSSKVKRGKKKRLVYTKDGKSRLKFNEIARNADGGGDVGGVHLNNDIQQSVNFIDYAKKTKSMPTVATTPYNAFVNNKEYNVQGVANENQRNNFDVGRNSFDKKSPDQKVNDNVNQNSYQKQENIVSDQRFRVQNDNAVHVQKTLNKEDDGAGLNVYEKPDNTANQNVPQKADTSDNQNGQQNLVNADVKQKNQKKIDTDTNQYVERKSDTGANQNARQNSDNGANQNAQQNSDTGANQNSFKRSNTGTNKNGQTGSQWKGFGEGFAKNFRRSDDVNKVYENRDVRRDPPRKTAFPKGKSRPDVKQREDVQWMEEYHSFSLRASVDNRFRIRYAPIPQEGSPWPLPQFYRPESTQYMIKPQNFKFNAAGETCDILEFAFDRTKKNLFGKLDSEEENKSEEDFRFFPQHEESPYVVEIKSLNVTVLKECGLFPQLEMDESYDLEIRKSGAVIIAREIWGAIRGLETFSQLVYQDSKSIFVVNRTLIHDFPRFKHRGILLDTSRHYLSKETIILNLEAMAQNKMNVFHWHIVDEQSFPFDSHTYPNLTKMGAYSPFHIYTHEVIKEIINEARLRGIRVVPEFDTPGHTFAWGFGQDNLLTQCYNYAGQPDGYFGPINPILKSTYRFLNGLFAEVLSLFKDKYVHLGGDEVSLDCWQTNPYLQRFMSRNKLYDVKDLLNVYERKLCDIIAALGKKRKVGSGYITWQEVFDDGVQLKPDAIVQIWKGDAWDIDRVTNKGYRALFSTCWYLDYINYGQDWDKYYKCEQIGPHLEMYNVRNESLLLGGDVCLWTEFADDESIMPRLWPRASAAAERLWSHKGVMDAEAAAPRIEAHRCRMKSRGIPVGVLSGPGYCKKHSKKAATFANLFDWVNQKADTIFSGDKKSGTKNIYVVDMHAMYLIPLILVVCLVCVVVLSSVQHSPVQKKFLTIITFPVTGSRRSVRGLIYIFMIFAVIWCIWTAPIWLHTWEHSNKLKK